jgi:tetratricopeptide (TPR) repeat protein
MSLERLPPEEAKALLKALAQVPEVALWLGEVLLPEKSFLEGVRALRQAFLLGGGEEEAKALLLRLPRVGEKEVLAFLEALLEAPFDLEPYLRAGVGRYLELAQDPLPLLRLYLKAPSPALEEALLELGKRDPEGLLPHLSGKDPWGLKRGLKERLLLALGREEEALGLMREHLEGPEDYLALVERLLALGREEEALRYAEEALEWFGKDPRLFPLVDLLARRRGRPEDLFLRFAFRPSLEDYAALKALLGRAFPEKRRELLKGVRDPALLARIHLLEEDWGALDRLLKGAPRAGLPRPGRGPGGAASRGGQAALPRGRPPPGGGGGKGALPEGSGPAPAGCPPGPRGGTEGRPGASPRPPPAAGPQGGPRLPGGG